MYITEIMQLLTVCVYELTMAVQIGKNILDYLVFIAQSSRYGSVSNFV